MWLPPSMVLTPLAKLKVASLKVELYWSAHSTRGAVGLLLDVDRPGEEHFAVLVEVPHEALDAALEVESHLDVVAVVDESEPEAFVQVGGLAEALQQDHGVEVDVLEDVVVGDERAWSCRSAPGRRCPDRHTRLSLTILTSLVGMPRS